MLGNNRKTATIDSHKCAWLWQALVKSFFEILMRDILFLFSYW